MIPLGQLERTDGYCKNVSMKVEACRVLRVILR